MKSGLMAAAVVAGTSVGTPVAAAAPPDGCAPMSRLIRQARTDFPSLRSLKMQPGVCTLRRTEYRCGWAFPGDAFGAAEAEAAALVQCASTVAAAAPQKLKRGETAVALESDLSLIVGAPAIDSGQWLVTLRIIAVPEPVN